MIHVSNLHKRHGTLEVLRGISLSVAQGEVAAIIGPSGGGKSTFLRCLNGLETFETGEVQIGAHKLLPRQPNRATQPTLRAVRQQLGMVFQQFNLFPHLTVLQNVMTGPQRVLRLEGNEAEARAKTLLDRVGLADKLHAWPGQLSGGQQQRVAIARALAMQPAAMLFDEPTSALDPRMTAEVLSVMSDLASDGQTMIVVTHAMHFARRAAKTVHVFHAGRVLESGPPEQIFDSPHEAITREFVSMHA